MANFIDIVFFFYIFVGLYMLSLFVFIYFPNRRRMFEYPKGKPKGVSIVMPCYNEGEEIGEAIESILELNYPKDLIEIIVVDDCSKDNSREVVRRYVKKYKNVRLIVNKKNSGGAAEPTNRGIKEAKYDYIAVTDADSAPEKDALIKMIGFLQKNKKIGAVTCRVMSKKPENFIQKLQAIEYVVISFNRRLLDLVDAVYVTPGPFALYRKEALEKVGLFDTENMTQDIEIVWRLMSQGYGARMCMDASVYSATPRKFGQWWRQRVRWNIGGTQTLMKYRSMLFRKGMLGNFIVPFFSISLFLGIFGLGIFAYLLFKRLFVSYLSTKYSLLASSTIVRAQDLTFAPSILNFLGGALFVLGLGFTLFGLWIVNEDHVKINKNIFNILFYIIIYLAIYPFIMVNALYKLARGNYSW